MRPTFRVGLSALMAYWGMIETSRKRKWFMARLSEIGSGLSVELHRPAGHLHPPFHEDQAVAQRRLAATGLAGQAHDLAVGDEETDAVHRLYVAARPW